MNTNYKGFIKKKSHFSAVLVIGCRAVSQQVKPESWSLIGGNVLTAFPALKFSKHQRMQTFTIRVIYVNDLYKLYIIQSLYHNSICFKRIIFWFWINVWLLDNTTGLKLVSTNQNFAILRNLSWLDIFSGKISSFSWLLRVKNKFVPPWALSKAKPSEIKKIFTFFASFFAIKMDLFQLQMENLSNQEEPIQFEKFMCHECETSFPNVEFLHEHVSILHEG